MPFQPGNQTVLEFTLIDFDRNWRVGGFLGGFFEYRATDKATLIVVSEGPTAVKTTNWFTVEKDESVLVGHNANIVHVPAKCHRREPGDKTECMK